MGFARGSLSKIDDHKPSMARVKKLADYFNVPMEYILGVEESEQKPGYYLNDETAQIAQQIFDDHDLRALFDAARGSTPEDLQMAAAFLKRLKETNPDG